MDFRRRTALRYLEYHAWATQKTFDAVTPLSPEELHRDLRNSHSSVFGTLHHVYQADAVWLKRHEGHSHARLDEVSAEDLPTLRAQASAVQGRLIAYAGALPDSDWDRVLEYRFLNGQEGQSPIYENLLHVVNHGTYHRGQITTLLRQLGHVPVATDYVHYIRGLTPQT